jgi:hypothetical protein
MLVRQLRPHVEAFAEVLLERREVTGKAATVHLLRIFKTII